MRKRSSPSVKITYFPKSEVWAALKGYAQELPQQRPEVRRILVFGSVARGDAVPGSDVDLLVVVSDSTKPFLQRMSDYHPTHFPVGAEVFAYTEAEIHSMLADGNWFIRRALEGQVLYEAP